MCCNGLLRGGHGSVVMGARWSTGHDGEVCSGGSQSLIHDTGGSFWFPFHGSDGDHLHYPWQEAA